MLTEADIYALLDAHGVEHHVLHHGPVLTVEAAHEAGISAAGETYGAVPCKNLFLRDDKGRHFWLVTAPDDAQIDLRMLQDRLDSRRLSFANADALERMLGIGRGSVTPFARAQRRVTNGRDGLRREPSPSGDLRPPARQHGHGLRRRRRRRGARRGARQPPARFSTSKRRGADDEASPAYCDGWNHSVPARGERPCASDDGRGARGARAPARRGLRLRRGAADEHRQHQHAPRRLAQDSPVHHGFLRLL